MGLREENTERRRQQILTATRELIALDGVHGWSMRKVADAANVSVPTLYNLFGSKDDIRAALCTGFFENLDLALDEAAPLDRPLDRALAFAARGVDHILDRAPSTRPALLAQEQGGDGGRRTTPMAIERQRESIQAAMNAGLLRDDLSAELLAAEAYDGLHRAAVQWARGRLAPAAFRSKAIYSTCICLLAAATDVSRLELVRTAQELEQELNSEQVATPAMR